jgi:hypothetical protein
LSSLPQAATVKARATVRQLEAATERTRKRFPPQGTNIDVRASLYRVDDRVQRLHR